jgi:hypothetical protein
VTKMNPRRRWWLGIAGLILLALVGVTQYLSMRREAALQNRLDLLAPLGRATEVSCTQLAARKPLVLLALGQSNAGNHGATSSVANADMMKPITMIWDGRCIQARDPLPGATGQGASIWPRLVALLEPDLGERPLVVSVLALDASTIDEWTRATSPLRSRLASQLASMKQLGMPPNAILWQQGEADARGGTSASEYAERLDRLADVLSQSGSTAPVYLAKSTVCRSPPSEPIRSAIEARVAQKGRWMSGPDTDALNNASLRHDGCHFSASGLDAAAQLWAAAQISK